MAGETILDDKAGAAGAGDDKGGAAAGAAAGDKGGAAAAGAAGAAAAGASADAGKGGAAGAAAADTAGKWPDDWRDQMAGADDKTRKLLERYSTPSAVVNALAAAQARIRSGELRTAFPKDGKPEEQAKWREENGLPPTPDKYDIKVEGVDQWDPETVKGVREVAHKLNLKTEEVNELLGWYAGDIQRRTEAQHVADEQFRTEAEDALRAEWGNDYRGNVNRINALLDGAPSGVKDQLIGARLADGKPLASHPQVLTWLADMSRQLNPTATVVPAGAAGAKSVDDRIADIEKTMRDNRDAYNLSLIHI